MNIVTGILAALALAELVALAVLGRTLARTRRENRRLRAAITEQRRTGSWARAAKAVVQTAARVREGGIGGLLSSSLDELEEWVTADRAGIASVAAPDGTVALLFSDIAGSTEINERLGDDRWLALLGTHNRIVRRQFARYNGHEVKAQGDGFMVAFHHATDAVRAARRVRSALRSSHSPRLRRQPLEVRIGVHVGPVLSRDGDYFGRNVAMSARIAALAEAGEILVSDEVRQALAEAKSPEPGGNDPELRPHGSTSLKGLNGTHQLWQVPDER